MYSAATVHCRSRGCSKGYKRRDGESCVGDRGLVVLILA
jgi:hypothetical protein